MLRLQESVGVLVEMGYYLIVMIMSLAMALAIDLSLPHCHPTGWMTEATIECPEGLFK
jgi:hypothetical protein